MRERASRYFRPTVEALENRILLVTALVQVSLMPFGAADRKHSADKKPVVLNCLAGIARPAGEEQFSPCPVVITNGVASHGHCRLIEKFPLPLARCFALILNTL